MAFIPGAAPTKKRTTTKKFVPGQVATPKPDVQNLEGLTNYAISQGIPEKEIPGLKPKKLSFLQRLGRGISFLEPANALYSSTYEGKNFAKEYVKDIFLEAGTAITGRELRKQEKKTFKDIFVKEGMKDRKGKIDLVDIAGLAVDIIVDPLNLVGGGLVKAGVKGTKAIGKAGLITASFVAPKKVETAVKAFDFAKDSLGKAFVYGYGSTPGLADDVVKFTNKIQEGRTAVGKKYTEMFENLSKQGKDDLVEGMFNMRKKFGAEREKMIKQGIKFEDATKTLVEKFDKIAPENLFKEKETIKFFANTLLPELQKQKKFVSNATQIGEDMLMSNYFPMIKKDTMKGFLNNSLRVSNEGWLKRYKGILEKSQILDDAAEAYATRAAQVQKDILTKEELGKYVGMFGKPLDTFKSVDEAIQNGYRVIKEKGKFGKEIGYLKETDHKFISDVFDPGFKVIENLSKAIGFDWYTKTFKKAMTGLFPSFHSRNFVSGMIQNYEAIGLSALNPKRIALAQKLTRKVLSSDPKAIDGTIKLGGKVFDLPDLMLRFRQNFGISSEYLKDFGWETQQKLIKSKKAKINPFEMARSIGNHIETQQKMTVYLSSIAKGWDVEDALKLAEKAGFDYSKITPFEKQVMRRLIPFYTFTRKNFELQLNTLKNNPQRLGHLTKIGRSAGTSQSTETGEGQFMPDWMRSRFTAQAGESAYGLPQVFAGFGTPIEEQAEMFDKGLMGILSRLNPVLKVPLERATGKDFFTERDLKDVYNANEYKEAPQIIKDWLKAKPVTQQIFKGGKPTGETKQVLRADPMRLQIARNLFTSRGISYLHTLFGDSELNIKGRIAKSLTGLRPYEIDEETTKFFENRNNYRDLLDMLQRMGVVKTFEKAFIPK